MTDEQIIKALECCNQEDMCDQCPYDFACYDEKYKSILSKDALDLINRQKAEIERLEKGVTFTFTIEDFDRLKEEVFSKCGDIQYIRKKAIKEFAERLKEKATSTFFEEHKYVDTEDIDEIANELTEPTKIEHNSLCETETYKNEGTK